MTGAAVGAEQRLTEVEIRLAHLERLAEDLSDVVARQDRRIDGLTERLRLLTDRLTEVEAGGRGISSADERPPPHY